MLVDTRNRTYRPEHEPSTLPMSSTRRLEQGDAVRLLAQDDDTQRRVEGVPLLLTAADMAALLRTTRKAVYAQSERGQLPGVVRIGRRLLFRRADVHRWLGLR